MERREKERRRGVNERTDKGGNSSPKKRETKGRSGEEREGVKKGKK